MGRCALTQTGGSEYLGELKQKPEPSFQIVMIKGESFRREWSERVLMSESSEG